MKLRTAALVAAAVLALAAVPALAHASGRWGHGDGAGHILFMAKKLGLSDAQTTQIQTIATTYRQGALGATMKSMRAAREALGATIHDSSATDEQVRAASASVAALAAQLAVQRHQMAAEISAVLTPDQAAKLAELRANFKNRHSGAPSGDPSGY
jgi:Spy/CpxP family protein refolding chaperone